ncbi:SGNH/GDSL hydrolase family protein [Streptomyces sp. NPDC060194]|uniref:SGNH/GDSL hydrolase family protein n=1 Tax=Streptomyces sp. NPDC060194 TaxID=3347069 RepID=UPI00364FAA63
MRIGRRTVLGALALTLLTACSDPTGAATAPPERPATTTAARPVRSAAVEPLRPGAKESPVAVASAKPTAADKAGATAGPTAGVTVPPKPRPVATPSAPAAASASASAQPTRGPAGRGGKARVLYLGDSIGMENQRVLADRVAADGRATVYSAPYSGTTVCDYLTEAARDSLVPPEAKAAALVRTRKPSVVVLQFWGNSWGYTPCMNGIPQGGGARYYERYASDIRTLTAQIEAAARSAGIRRPTIVWALQGPDVFAPDRVRRVNALYTDLARRTGDRVSDAGARVAPANARYQWVQRLPCTPHEQSTPDCGAGTVPLHRDDDPLHFCLAPTLTTPRPCPVRSPGIVRYTDALARTVDAVLRGGGRG